MIRDLLNELGAPVTSILNAVKTSDGNGSSADLRNYRGALIVADVGNSGDTLSGSVYLELEVEESDDDSSFTDVADADLHGYVDGTNDGCFAKIDAPAEDSLHILAEYKGSKRYIRAVVNVTGSHSSGIPVGVCIIPYGHSVKPT